MPIKLKHDVGKFVFFYIFLACLITGTASAEDGLQILKQAESTMESISFSAKCDWSDGFRIALIQKKGEPGQRPNYRREITLTMQGIAQTSVWILNQDGLWNILPMTKKAIRMDCLKISTNFAFYGMLENSLNLSTEADYSSEFRKVNGREMVVVTRKSHFLADGLNSQIIESKIFIGRDDHILYGYTSTSRGGEVKKMTVTEFKLMENIANDFFELPAGLQENICTNIAQYSRQTIEEEHILVQTPAYKNKFQISEKQNGKIRYLVISIMFIPTIIFAWFIFRRRF